MTEPNAEQIRYWNEEAGPRWLRADAALGRVLAPLGDVAIDRAAAKEGERVLDVGCGSARTSIELARRVGPRGSVFGVDISKLLLERAREHLAQEKLSNVSVAFADAQT